MQKPCSESEFYQTYGANYPCQDAPKDRSTEVWRFFASRLWDSSERIQHAQENGHIIPEGWGWFSTTFGGDKIDQQFSETGFLIVGHDARRWPNGVLYSTAFTADSAGIVGYILGPEEATIILAPPDYFLSEPGNNVELRMHAIFPKGATFTLVGTQEATFHFEGDWREPLHVRRSYVVPQGLEDRYRDLMNQPQGIAQFAPARIIVPRQIH